VTDADVAFFVDGGRVPMEAGECWYLNVNLPHRVDNRSQTDRIHLVIDCVVDDWLAGYFPPEAGPRPAERGPTHLLLSQEEGLERFRAVVLEDRALQAGLREPSDRQTFVALVVELGAKHGYLFSPECVSNAMQASQRAWLERWIA